MVFMITIIIIIIIIIIIKTIIIIIIMIILIIMIVLEVGRFFKCPMFSNTMIFRNFRLPPIFSMSRFFEY